METQKILGLNWGWRSHTLLQSAVIHGKYEMAGFLLEKGAKPNANVPLMSVTDVAMACLLLKHGANPNKYDGNESYKATPLASAIQRANCCEEEQYISKRKVVEVLLKYGADPNKGVIYKGKKMTPLMIQCLSYREHTDIIKLLLDYGADPDIKFNNQVTALDFWEYTSTWEHRKQDENYEKIHKLLESKMKTKRGKNILMDPEKHEKVPYVTTC